MSVELKEKEFVGGKRKRELIAVYIPKEQKVALETWATSEERSVSWIVAKLIDQALCDRAAGTSCHRQKQQEGADNDK
jgi:CopG-like RHH_1 or ribbon-helix-helix domain, RHH_5